MITTRLPETERVTIRGTPAWSGWVLVLALALAPAAQAAVVGAIAGLVRDEQGVPQMGAVVSLLTAEGRIAKRVYTDPRGAFQIGGLFPGNYSIRVSLDRFVPTVRDDVAVSAGVNTYLDVSLRGVFSSLQLVFPGGGEIRDMSEQWKWVLRTSAETRPALRFRDGGRRETEKVLRKLSGPFGETRGYAEVSAGGGARTTGLSTESDLGTAFAVATSVFGNNNVTVSGNLGYGQATGAPIAGFRTSYSRDFGLADPEVSVTVRQLQTPFAARQALFGPQDSERPQVQTFSVGLSDRAEITESTRFEYGFLFESVAFLDRMSVLSPYGRIVHELGPDREIHLRYASGVPQPADNLNGAESLRTEVSSLGMLPRLSLQDGRTRVQRTQHVEIAYRERVGDGLIEAAVFEDRIADAAVTGMLPGEAFAGGNVLPDLFSNTATVNAGRHRTKGYRVSYARKIRDRLQAAVGYGHTGVLSASTDKVETADVRELRDALSVNGAHLLMASLSSELPGTKTKVVSTYQWASRAAVMAPDLYNDFAARSDPGWNIIVRQPLPMSAGLPGKLEATADFRNLLGSGYNTLTMSDGRQIYLIQAIRSYRGALSFIF